MKKSTDADKPRVEIQGDDLVIKGLPKHLFDRMLTSSSLQARDTLEKLLDKVRAACQLGMQTEEDKQRIENAILAAERQEQFLNSIGDLKDSWETETSQGC